jgi:hypothetical protein
MIAFADDAPATCQLTKMCFIARTSTPDAPPTATTTTISTPYCIKIYSEMYYNYFLGSDLFFHSAGGSAIQQFFNFNTTTGYLTTANQDILIIGPTYSDPINVNLVAFNSSQEINRVRCSITNHEPSGQPSGDPISCIASADRPQSGNAVQRRVILTAASFTNFVLGNDLRLQMSGGGNHVSLALFSGQDCGFQN